MSRLDDEQHKFANENKLFLLARSTSKNVNIEYYSIFHDNAKLKL